MTKMEYPNNAPWSLYKTTTDRMFTVGDNIGLRGRDSLSTDKTSVERGLGGTWDLKRCAETFRNEWVGVRTVGEAGPSIPRKLGSRLF